MIRTKIVCTLGPASRSPEMIHDLIEAGLSVARLNFSHGDHAYHGGTMEMVREASEKVGKPVAILGDLQGPKLRVGDMGEEGVEIRESEKIVLTTEEGVTGQRLDDVEVAAVVPVRYNLLPRDVRPGEHILLDDGLLELKVINNGATKVTCRVIIGGTLKSNKGLNMPRTHLSIPSITEKDWNDLDYMLEHEVDWIALSFVRTAEDVNRLKSYILENHTSIRPPLLISKIEKPEALADIDAIIEASDGIMVARGDLGIEIPPEEVPLVQKDLIRRCNNAGKPVITATQMLDSMIRNPRPTRAEASDVANAILDGTDAIMLSGETASGRYPLESVGTMARIAEEIEEKLMHVDGKWRPPVHVKHIPNDVTDAVSYSTCETAETLDVTAIVTATSSGRTARSVGRYRPHVPIIAVTPNAIVQRQLQLSWGVVPLLSREVDETTQVVNESVGLAASRGLIKDGDQVIVTAGVATNMPGKTNLMMVELVGSAGQINFADSEGE